MEYSKIVNRHIPGFLLVLLILTRIGASSKDADSESKGINMKLASSGSSQESTFIPTHEWQIVGEDQVVPSGLHYRMNMQTGLKEAKFMDKDPNQHRDLPALVKTIDPVEKEGKPNTGAGGPDKQKVTNMEAGLSREEILKALKDIKADDVKDTKVAEEEIKSKYRSYEELKEDFRKMNMAVKTDQEIITELVAEFNTTALLDEARRVTILTDLEYYLHQIDNARFFSDNGGIELLVQVINASSVALSSEAMFALGSAVQSNGKVQIRALECRCLPLLLTIIKSDNNEQVLNRAVYALSGLLRHFPLAQQRFLSSNGVPALGSLFNVGRDIAKKIRLKGLTLIHDLLTEKISQAENADLKLSIDREKKKQYDEVKLEPALSEHGWCENIALVLMEANSSPDNHDLKEKVLLAMRSSVEFCSQPFKRLHSVLAKIISDYQDRLDVEKDDEFFTGMLRLASEVTGLIAQTTNERTEL